MKFLLLVLAGLFLTSCSSVPVPSVPKDIQSLSPIEGWKQVLKKYVDDKGRVNFSALAKAPAPLHLYVEWVSRVSPQTEPNLFPTRWDKLAHYINSYNALSMYNVLDSDIPKSLSGLKKVSFFFLKKVPVGGEKMSLYAYENEVIRAQGEERVHFALNCMSGGCPRLPNYAFYGPTLEAEFEKQAKIFFNEDRNVKVDREKKIVYLSEILKFYTDDFLKKAPNLIVYANKYRKEKLPENFEVDFIPYDWTINSQPEVLLAPVH